MGVSTLKSKISWVNTVVGNDGHELALNFETMPV